MRSLVLLFIPLVMASTPVRAASPKVGDKAPPFELTLVDGTKVKSEELEGKVIILNFWATWCAPCREELPLLDGYYSHAKDHGLRIFAITTEGSIPIRKLGKLFDELEMPSVRRIKGNYGVLKGLPTNFIIDRHGRIVHAAAGALTLDRMNDILLPLIREPVPEIAAR
jgi:thiol-disulfide isomerase/thioredoxin